MTISPDATTLLDRLPAAFDDASPALRKRRERAAELLRRRGLPTRKDEAWRFTSVRAIVDHAFVDAPPPSGVEASRSDDGVASIELVDGRVVSDLPALANVDARNLRQAMGDDAAGIDGLLGAAPEDAPFAALNDALFQDGLVIEVAGDASALHLVHRRATADRATIAYPRIVVHLRSRARFVLFETHETDGRAPSTDVKHVRAPVVDVVLGEGAELVHVRLYDDPGVTFARVAVRQRAESRYLSRVFTTGGSLVREDLAVTIEGVGASTELEGIYVCTGDEHSDHHVRVEHRVGHAISRMRYRGVVADRASSVFDGTSIVGRGAPKTEAHQENRNLLLGPDATVHTKPHLRIDTDDVACSHGATVGTLDADQLFYLTARGIPRVEAEALLVQAFLGAIISRVPTDAMRARVARAVFRKLPHGSVPEGALE
jgi:Fe-S cluster assembly protein SufD